MKDFCKYHILADSSSRANRPIGSKMQSVGALFGANSRGALSRCIKPSIRPFSSTHACQIKIPRAPSTRRQQRPLNAQGIPDNHNQRREWIEALIGNRKATIAQFGLAKKAGAINIEPEDSIEFLRSYCNTVAEPGWEVRFCRGEPPIQSLAHV